MFRSICDWSWALSVYFCGKVLRIKKYRPVCTPHDDGIDLVRLTIPITARRLTRLMRLWGYRIPTIEEARQLQWQELEKQVMQPTPPTPFPYFNCQGDDEEKQEPKPNWFKDDDWNNPHRFLSTRW